MTWVVEDDTDDAKQPTPQKQSWIVEDDQESEPSTSLLRAGLAPVRGALLGAGIYGSLQSALAPGEMPTPEKPLPGQAANWRQEHEILSRMEQPSYVPSIAELMSLSSDDPISENLGALTEEQIGQLIDETTKGELIPQTATERFLTKIPKTATEFALLAPGGQTGKELSLGALFGGGEQIAEEAGFGAFGQFVSGVGSTTLLPLGIKAGLGMLRKASEMASNIKKILSERGLPEGTPRFFEEVGTKRALADLELSSKDIAARTSQISDEAINEFEKNSGSKAWKPIADTGSIDAAEIEKEIVERNEEAILSAVASKPKTHKEGWTKIKEVVEAGYDDAHAAYKALYDDVEKEAKNMRVEPTDTFQEAKNLRKETKSTLYQGSEEKGLRNAAEVLVKKLIKPQGKLAETIVADLKKEGIFADYEEILELLQKDALKGPPKAITLDRLIATSRSISRILSKADIIPAPVKLLSGIQKALKRDIYRGLGKKSGIAEMYGRAEKLYAETHEMYGNDAILKFRKTESPESMTTHFSSSSNKQKLNNVLVGHEDALNLADRMIIEQTSKKSKDAATIFSREMGPYLESEGRYAMEKLREIGDKLTSPGQQSLIRGNALSDVQKAFEEGTRPEYTLKLMQNKNGYNLISNALNNTPQGKSIFKTLQRQTVLDLFDSITTDTGRIDFEKAKDLFKNPFHKQVVQNTIGADGLKFFERLEGYGKNLSKNLEMLSKKEPSLMAKIADKYIGKTTAGIFALLLPSHPAIGSAGLAMYTIKMGAKILSNRAERSRLFAALENPTIRNAVKTASAPNATPASIENSFFRINQMVKKLNLDEEDDEL